MVDRVRVDLGGRTVLEDIEFDLSAGEFLGVVGPNGGGKTTLLRTLLGIHRPTAGRVRWCSTSRRRPGLTPAGARLGYVPQKCEPDRSCPLSAREVLSQGASDAILPWGRHRRDTRRRADELLHDFGLADSADKRFVELSGGQQRRLLLARAVIGDPEVLLLDEPSAGLDVDSHDRWARFLPPLLERGVAVILVSHDLEFVASHAHRVAQVRRRLVWAKTDADERSARPAGIRTSRNVLGPSESPISRSPSRDANAA